MNLDEQLLNNQNDADSSAARAGDLREAQRESAASTDDNQSAESPKTLRETVLAAKRAEADKEKKEGGAGDKAAGAITAPMRRGTSKLLQQAWLNLIDSFGLTLIWINIHVFLKQIFGEKFFCKLGSEWLPETPSPAAGAGAAGGGPAGMAESAAGKEAEKSFETVETMGLCCLDFGCLLLILTVFIVAGAVIKVVSNPLEAISALFGLLWGAITGK